MTQVLVCMRPSSSTHPARFDSLFFFFWKGAVGERGSSVNESLVLIGDESYEIG